MDDWNDFGAPPSDPISQQPYGEQDSSSQGSFASLFGSQGGGGSRSGEEPCSVMFRVPPRRSSSAAPISTARSESSTGAPEQLGDLDDETDFDEIGVSSSERTPLSDSDRYHKKSYTKLEVIRAAQIQHLVHIFHVVVAIAACWTLFSVIISNTMFADVRPLPVRNVLLSEAIIAKARAEKQKPVRVTWASIRDVGQLGKQYTIHSFLKGFSDTSFAIARAGRGVRDVEKETYSCIRCLEFCKGIDIQFNEVVNAGTQDCLDPSHVCHNVIKFKCMGEPLPLVRQTVEKFPGVLTPDGNKFTALQMRISKTEKWYKFVVHVTIFTCGTVVFFLAILFLIRIVRAGRKNLAQEQIFALCLLFVTFLYLNVPLSVLQAHSALGKTSSEPFPKWYNDMESPLRVLRDLAFGPFMFFYLWANIHTYRILDPSQKLGASFFIPKLVVLIPFAFLKMSALFTLGFVFSEVPFISAILMQHTFGRFQIWAAFRKEMAYLIVISLYEIMLLLIIVWETVKTVRVLRRAPYMRHRAKQIGFRFFMYISLVYFSAFFFLQVLLVVARPTGEPIEKYGLLGGLELTIPWSEAVGTVLLTFGYVVISAYVNLPYDSVGAVKGWFKGSDVAPASSRWSVSSSEGSFSMSDNGSGSGAISGSVATASQTDRRPREQQPSFIVDKDYELNQEIVEPITYRKRESEDSLELKANCFTMQTHVIMFNFAWYVYYYGTPKFANLKPQESVLPFRFTVAESISEPATDTHALVIDGLDRIVVTFKGTTSMRNLQTSMKIYHERLINVVPTDLDGVDELERLRIIFGRSYEAAKIHKGFAIAYSSVAHRVMRRIKKLIEEKPRPVFLTGHSLGGALATICSLDIWIKLRISRRQIFVSTFGSPRVGNEAFRRIYNSVIALHWRIVVDPDMVAKLPKVGYRHVGKKVLLTPHGEMFIDPDALELKLWSGNAAGFAYHRKASYLLAMRAWCVRHHKMSYTPAFWPFPVREEDYQRFEGANMEEEQEEIPGNKLAEKIIRMDAMVDSLDDGTYANMAAIEKWARLTRRVLLSRTLTGAMNQ